MVIRLPFQPKRCRSITSGEIPRACCRYSRTCGGRLRWYSRASCRPSDIDSKLTRRRQSRKAGEVATVYDRKVITDTATMERISKDSTSMESRDATHSTNALQYR